VLPKRIEGRRARAITLPPKLNPSECKHEEDAIDSAHALESHHAPVALFEMRVEGCAMQRNDVFPTNVEDLFLRRTRRSSPLISGLGRHSRSSIVTTSSPSKLNPSLVPSLSSQSNDSMFSLSSPPVQQSGSIFSCSYERRRSSKLIMESPPVALLVTATDNTGLNVDKPNLSVRIVDTLSETTFVCFFLVCFFLVCFVLLID
jgi:hypothetical protein